MKLSTEVTVSIPKLNLGSKTQAEEIYQTVVKDSLRDLQLWREATMRETLRARVNGRLPLISNSPNGEIFEKPGLESSVTLLSENPTQVTG